MDKAVDVHKDSNGNLHIDQVVLRSLLDYSPDSGEFTWRDRSGGFRLAGKLAGCEVVLDGKHYIVIKVLQKAFLAHRLAFIYMEGFAPEEVDHLDGNGLNNAWSNLQKSDKVRNKHNQKLRSDNKSGRQGVHPCRGKWRARLTYRGEIYELGVFDTKDEAIAARETAEKDFDFLPGHGTKRPL